MKNFQWNLLHTGKKTAYERGITLIELLVAISISLLLMGIIFAVYSSVISTARVQKERSSHATPASMTIDMLTRDLSCAVHPAGLSHTPFILERPTNNITETALRFFSVIVTEPGEPLIYDIFEIQYLAKKESDSSTLSVTRQARFLRNEGADSEPFINERLFQKADSFSVELFDGNNWTNAWGQGEESAIPQAARIKLIYGKSIVETETVIPAGCKISN